MDRRGMDVRGLGLGAVLACFFGGVGVAQEIAVPDELPDFVAEPARDSAPSGSRLDKNVLDNGTRGEGQNGENGLTRDLQNPVPQVKNGEETEIKINQPYSSEVLGSLLLPFMWEVQEDTSKKRLVATEVRTHAPAVLTIDFLDKLERGIDSTVYMESIVSTFAEALGLDKSVGKALEHEEKSISCDKKKCPKMSIYRTVLEGNENGVARRCAFEIVPNEGKLLVLTLCAAAEQKYSPDISAVLKSILGGMQ